MIDKLFEFKLIDGQSIVGEVANDSGDQYIVYDPLILRPMQQGTFTLQKYFLMSDQRWITLHDSTILAMAKLNESGAQMYMQTTIKLYGKPNEPEFTLPADCNVH